MHSIGLLLLRILFQVELMHHPCLYFVYPFRSAEELSFDEGLTGLFQHLTNNKSLVDIAAYTYRSMIGHQSSIAAF